MTISSMTGFARSDGSASATGASWTWEVRSVNGRGLDVRLRLPPGLDDLEPAARDIFTKRLTRGNISATLSFDRGAQNGGLRLNESVLSDVIAAADRVVAITGGASPSAAELLAVKGVLESGDQVASQDPEAIALREARNTAILQTLTEAVDGLCEGRRAEGARLEVALLASVSEIEKIVKDVRANPALSTEAITNRLRETVNRLIEANDSFDRERLHQEAVIAATRADVEEELTRLEAHCAAARELLAGNGAIGRKLDFLAQEFNREANTLCSKAVSIEITRLGLALKSVIDQLREQIQNIE